MSSAAGFTPRSVKLPADVVRAREAARQERRERSLADVTEEVRRERLRREYSLEGLFRRRGGSSRDAS